MKVEQAYNVWADQYDSSKNKTRDLEAFSLRRTLDGISFDSCLEIGCGTGKNTVWLISKAKNILAVDFSEKMLVKAKIKTRSDKVRFVQADINDQWTFANKQKFELVTFSLVLEHISRLERIFENLNRVVAGGGYVYIGELHPFKQYCGTKARFETGDGVQVVTCFNHHISDFTMNAVEYGFSVVEMSLQKVSANYAASPQRCPW